jgi:hypothetical protein
MSLTSIHLDVVFFQNGAFKRNSGFYPLFINSLSTIGFTKSPRFYILGLIVINHKIYVREIRFRAWG